MKKYTFLLDPNPADGGGSSGMADSIMSELNSASSAPAPAPEPAPSSTPSPEPAPTPSTPAATAPKSEPVKPVEKGKPAAPAKPAATQVKPTAPQAEKPLDWKTAPENFRAAHEKLQKVFDAQTRELQSKLQTTEGKMRELEQREYLTPEQKQQYAKMQERQQKLEADLYARDYRESPEFKAKYQAKADKIFQTVQHELKGIQVQDDNGNQRPATIADFAKVRALGDSQVEQRRQAKSLFGDDADVVLTLARELKSIEDIANDEIEAKRNGFQSERQQQEQKMQAEIQTGQRVFGEYDKQIIEKYPAVFGKIDGNDEYNAALEKGLAFVDSNSSNFNSKTPEERAQSAALVRRFAAVAPALIKLTEQQKAIIAERDATILKLQGSDPGNGGDGGAPAQSGDSDSGTDTLTAEIERLQREG